VRYRSRLRSPSRSAGRRLTTGSFAARASCLRVPVTGLRHSGIAVVLAAIARPDTIFVEPLVKSSQWNGCVSLTWQSSAQLDEQYVSENNSAHDSSPFWTFPDGHRGCCGTRRSILHDRLSCAQSAREGSS
jgi:hypothetical protein